MEFNNVIQNKYSCRAFAERAVEQEKVDRILEAGRIAPTAVNKQPVHVWAVSNPETLEAIKGVTRSNYGAPLLLIVGCRPADAWVRRYDGKNGAEVDASIVATYLMLAAENEGLATLWVGSFDPALLKGILLGTDGYELVAMINVGYPSEKIAPSVMHGTRVEMGGVCDDAMNIDQHILDALTAQAKSLPRLRINLDRRGSGRLCWR